MPATPDFLADFRCKGIPFEWRVESTIEFSWLIPQTISATCVITAWATARFNDGGFTRSTARQAVITASVVSRRTRTDFSDSRFGRGRGRGAVVAAGVIAAWTSTNLAQWLLSMHRKRGTNQCNGYQTVASGGAGGGVEHGMTPVKDLLRLCL